MQVHGILGQTLDTGYEDSMDGSSAAQSKQLWHVAGSPLDYLVSDAFGSNFVFSQFGRESARRRRKRAILEGTAAAIHARGIANEG